MNFLAVFIDLENLEKTAKQEAGAAIDYKQLAAFVHELARPHGKVTNIYAYADFDKGEMGKQTKLMNLGIQPKHVVTKTPFQYLKGSTDIELSLDILDTMYQYAHISHFLIISGDGDLRHVIRRLKINGKTIHVVGFAGHTNKLIVEMADYFCPLEFHHPILRKITMSEREEKTKRLFLNPWAKIVVETLDHLERTTKKEFIGLNLFRKRLVEKYPAAEISDALTDVLDCGCIDTYSVPNPEAPDYPTTACRLQREHRFVQAVLKGENR